MTKEVVDLSSCEGCQRILDTIIISDEGSIETKYIGVFAVEMPSAISSIVSSSDKKEDKKRHHKLLHDFCDKTEKLLQDYAQFPANDLASLLSGIAKHPSVFSEFPMVRKNLLKHLIGMWSSASSEAIRVSAFLGIHSFCKKYSKLLDSALKSMYQNYHNATRSLSSHTLGQASLMLNGLVEIFSLSPVKGVEFASKYIRQMAGLVQGATKHPDKDHLKPVLSWQFISALRLWTRLLIHNMPSQSSGKKSKSQSPFSKLVYPFCSLINVLLSFQPSPKYFGFHFHCVSVAIELSSAAGLFFPVSAPLLKIISYVAKQPLYKMETKKAAYDLVATIKVPKSEVATKGYLDCVFEEAIYYLILWSSKSIDATFPEKISPLVASLTDVMSRMSQIDRNLKKQIEGHLSKLTQQKKEIEAWRVAEGLTPLKLKESPCTIPKERQCLNDYLVSIEKVRTMRKKILADRQAEQDEQDDLSDAEVKPKVVKKKTKPISDDYYGEEEKEQELEETPKSKKRKSESTSKTSSSVKKSKKDKLVANADDEEDIVEDFVLD